MVKKRLEIILFLLRRIIPVTLKIFPGLMGVMGFVLLLQAILPLLQVYFMTQLINCIQQVVQGSLSFSVALTWLGIQSFMSVFSALMLLCAQLLQKKMHFKISFFFEKLVKEKTQKLSLIHYEIPECYDLLAQTNGAGEKGLEIMTSLWTICMYLVTIMGYLITLMHYHFLFPLLVIGLAIPNIFLNIKVSEERYKQILFQSPNTRKASYITQLFKERDSIKEIKLYQTGRYLLNKWIFIYWKQADEKYKLEKKASVMGFMFDNMGVLTLFLTSGMLIFISSQRKLSLGEYIALTMAISSAEGMIKMIANHVAKMYEDSLFVKRLYAFLDLPEEIQNKNSKKFPEKLVKGIEIRDLSFYYPGKKEAVLRHVSLSVRPDEKVAVVGDNGAGKSTLIKCMLGLYPVPNKTIFFDDIDINEIDRVSLYENISVIFQDFVRYNFTVRENVGFGNLSKIEDNIQLNEATTKANIKAMINKLPAQFETELGPVFTGGQDISGGQWQKIALSRAFLKNAPIVIFDEPTSSLDAIAETQIFKEIIHPMKENMTLFISHRLSSCRLVDRIIVIEKGSIIECGSYKHLMNQEGRFAQMFRNQSVGYERFTTTNEKEKMIT